MYKILWLYLLTFSTVVMANNDWKLIKNKNDIKIYSLQKQNYKLKHYKSQVLINKNAYTILAALKDTNACSQWVFNCLSNKRVSTQDQKKRIFHTIIKSPLWFKNRDFYVQSNLNYDSANKLTTIQLNSIPNFAAQNKSLVRVSNIEMIWSLKFIGKNKTMVNYQVYIDPKFPIKSLNNRLIIESMHQTLLGLIRIVENPIYAEQKFP